MNHLLHHYGTIAIALLIALEYLGIPLPTELAYVAGSGFVATGKLQYWQLFAVIMLAHTVGAYAAYALGRRARGLAKRSRRLTNLQKKLEGWYEKYGALTVLGTQLVGHIRPWASYIAGFSRVPLPRFMVFSTLGSALLTFLMLALADTLVALWHHLPFLRVILFTLFAGFVLVAIILAVKSFFRPDLGEPAEKR